MPSYEYHHQFMYRDMSKAAFLDKLSKHHSGDDLERVYNQMKRSGKMFIYPGEWFQIKKEKKAMELNNGQIMRLQGILEVKAPLTSVNYIGEGMFECKGYETEFTLSLSEKDSDWVLKGIGKLTRGE